MSRKRYRYDLETKTLVEIDADWTDAPRGSGAPVTDLYMDGARTTDGVDIGSRAKRRAYMKAAGVTDTSDYAGEWAKAAKQREAVAEGRHDKAGRIEALRHALNNAPRRK